MSFETEEEPANKTWRLRGRISDPSVVDPATWCALLGPDRNCLYGDWGAVLSANGTVEFLTGGPIGSISAGSRLTFGGTLHAFAAILIEDGPSEWEEHEFSARSAIATHFTDEKGEGWRCLEPLKAGQVINPDSEVIQDAWDHEHCLICNGHIDPGDRFFEHRTHTGYFLCVKCYENHALTGDLSFLVQDRDD